MKTSAFRIAATLLVAATITSLAAATETHAIFKSSDGGQSWIRSDAGMPEGSRINAFGSAEGVVFAGTDSGIFCSRDEARTWQPAKGVAMPAVRVLSFANVGRKVFAGTDDKGILVSSEGGQSWVFCATFPSRKVRSLLCLRGELYAGTDAEGVFASGDGGQTWTRLSAGFPSDAQVFSTTEVEGVLFAGLYSRGLYAWDEKEHSWLRIGGVTPLVLASVGRTLIAGHNPGGLYLSRDFGVTWLKGIAGIQMVGPLGDTLAKDAGELSDDAPVWAAASNDSLVFAGASAGIYYSGDFGRSWTRARRGLPEASPGIAFLAKQKFVLAATTLKGNHAEP